VETTMQDTDVSSEDGKVLSQSPSSGTVTTGTRVQLVIGVYVPPDDTTTSTTPEGDTP